MYQSSAHVSGVPPAFAFSFPEVRAALLKVGAPPDLAVVPPQTMDTHRTVVPAGRFSDTVAGFAVVVVPLAGKRPPLPYV